MSEKKFTEDDARLLGLLDDPPKTVLKKVIHKYIHIPIDRKYLGMTQKERDAAKKVSKRK